MLGHIFKVDSSRGHLLVFYLLDTDPREFFHSNGVLRTITFAALGDRSAFENLHVFKRVGRVLSKRTALFNSLLLLIFSYDLEERELTRRLLF